MKFLLFSVVGDPLTQIEAGYTTLTFLVSCDFGIFIDCLPGGTPVVRQPGIHQLVGPALAQGGVRHLDQVSQSIHTQIRSSLRESST